ncbi:hypothetical protein LY90DRAFT_663794 [Neocallimastix californiae]|uniref:Oxidation resistance protein 1 n=1 Tax=Neocallimastix californiae TaxID=1754190 RepID=A0A1Y2FIB9_9FUNG|nr:hypothetical protein LY90DRAFT_663794 [Neocallimastix californiae]|eukprot:ORY83357.1 hypothetical protein LY90DRAFT_663794 [Neocallimastix californiae]
MANIDNSNNFFIKAPKFSWLKFSYSQEKLNDINFLKNQGVKSTIRNNKSETENNIESRSQSFIELTKLLTDNCQYGILDEYAGTKEERENEKKEKKLRIQKKQKEKMEEKEFEEKIKNEYVIVDKNVPNIPREEINRMQMQISQNQNQTIPLEKEDINVIDMKNTNPLEKIEINKTDKNFFNHVPFSAPIKSNKNENFKNEIKRSESFDENIIHINDPILENISNNNTICRQTKNVSILSNSNTSIEIKTPKTEVNDIEIFKAFLKGEYDPLKDEKYIDKYDNDDDDSDDEIFENRNQLEKFKTNESSTSLNVLLENINIKCSHENIPRNDSIESLESVEFDTKQDDSDDKNKGSWLSNISKSLQSWLNPKEEFEFHYFTKTDKDGNIKVLSVESIMELYDLDYSQALNIHDYVSSMIPTFPQNITGYTKYIEKLNKEISLKENKTLELICKNYGYKPIITRDLAIKLQSQLPYNIHNKFKWTIQFSLNSVNNEESSPNNTSNLSQLFFLWKYQNSKLKVFKPVDDCNDLIYSNDEFLSIGGNNDGQFALYLDKDLKNGHSYRNKTFKNKILSLFNDFYISDLELWTFD